MQKYSVIKIQGKQYFVEEGKEILVDKLKTGSRSKNEKDRVAEPVVLLHVDGDKVIVGKPEVAGVRVKFKVLADTEKGKKLEVFKYKSKSRYRKHIGFRPQYSRLLIEKIG